jgi:hypothetical protein
MYHIHTLSALLSISVRYCRGVAASRSTQLALQHVWCGLLLFIDTPLNSRHIFKQFEGETLTEDTLLEVWRRYDLDGSGHLDRDELYAVRLFSHKSCYLMLYFALRNTVISIISTLILQKY